MLLTNALLPDGSTVDVEITGDVVTAVRPAGTSGPATSVTDLDGYLLVESLVEPHAHLDKVFTVDRVANPLGTLAGAMAGYEAVLLASDAADIRRRARRALRLLVRNGVTAVRTHLGCGRLLGLRAVEAFAQVREEMAPYVDLEVVAHVGGPAAGVTWGEHVRILRDALAAGADAVGGNPFSEAAPDEAMDACLQVAVDAGCPVDLHVDETTDGSVLTLRRLASLAAQVEVPVTASHAVSLGSLAPALADEVAAEVAAAGLAVVTLPATNLHLQGRGAHPTPRGLTALDALERAGVSVAAGGDNVRDPFNPVGRLDPFETASLLVTAGHRTLEQAWRMTVPAARAVLRLPQAGPVVGRRADLLAVRAASLGDAIALAPADRLVLRSGRVVSRTTTTTSGPVHDEGPA
ncbi:MULTISPECIES: amidohydrolase family protein [unclassified Actinotalea]|uniref:amidohydrolase family protein n=1 Tax=unclassified Actinotalea TaxID=2638618 RepID=UPI0015F59C7D|nr:MULTISPECIES: amidohydrolase family protein [unclassified Actinotalea]